MCGYNEATEHMKQNEKKKSDENAPNIKVVQFSVDVYKIADECGFKKEEIELFFCWG